MSDDISKRLDSIPQSLRSLFLPQLVQLDARMVAVPFGVAGQMDCAEGAGWFWACAIGDDCLITTMHVITRRAFVLQERPEVDYFVIGLLSDVDATLVGDMSSTQGSFLEGFSPVLNHSAMGFAMRRGLSEFEMEAGSHHDSCNICILPSFVERMQGCLGPKASDLALALKGGIDLNGSKRLRATMAAIEPKAALRAGAALHYRALVYEVLAELASYLGEVGSQGETSGTSAGEHLVEAVNATLLASLNDPPTLEELARSLYVGKTHLCQTFKGQMGMSIGERLSELRIREAKRRLEKSTESVGSIARSVGFSHTSSFSAMFVRHTGMTPTQWRKRA